MTKQQMNKKEKQNSKQKPKTKQKTETKFLLPLIIIFSFRLLFRDYYSFFLVFILCALNLFFLNGHIW